MPGAGGRTRVPFLLGGIAAAVGTADAFFSALFRLDHVPRGKADNDDDDSDNDNRIHKLLLIF